MAERLTLPPAFNPSDAPDWLKHLTPEQYAQRRNEEIASMKRQLSHGYGETVAGWIYEAAGQLQAIGHVAPEFGSLHHTTLILADRLNEIAHAALESVNDTNGGYRSRKGSGKQE